MKAGSIMRVPQSGNKLVTEKHSESVLYIDVSPLWELQYTGISNVVYEMTRRFHADEEVNCEFMVFNKPIQRGVIEACLQQRNGSPLRKLFDENRKLADVSVDASGRVNGRKAFGLYTNTKPHKRVFMKDSQIFYDFSFLLAQETHNEDTVKYHSHGIVDQIESNDLFFCISEATAKDLEWIFNVPEEKIKVALLGNNVDATLATAARKKIAHRAIEPYILMLGTIEPRKNVNIVLSWLRSNPKVLKEFRFVFAGKEGWGAKFMDYVHEYGIADEVASGKIIHLGYVDEALKATLLVGARAVLYPSIFEGFGLPVLEAMEIGTPVIASCSTSIPEVLGDAGYYFDPYSVSSFDDAFTKFYEDKHTGQLDMVCQKARLLASKFSYDKTYGVIRDALISKFFQ